MRSAAIRRLKRVIAGGVFDVCGGDSVKVRSINAGIVLGVSGPVDPKNGKIVLIGALSNKEFERAKRAKEFKRIMNFASDNSLIRGIQAGDFINLDVVSDDVKNARKMFGPELPEVEGKHVRRKPFPDQAIESPEFIPALSGNVIAYVELY